MKNRDGYISNSSSSTFIIITTKVIHNKVMQYLSDDERQTIDALMDNDCIHVIKGNKLPDLVEIIINTNDNGSELDDLDELDPNIDVVDAFDNYIALIHKEGYYDCSPRDE